MHTDYEYQNLKTRFKAANRERDALRRATRLICHALIRSGYSERQAARLAGLDLDELHELIGIYAEYQEELQICPADTGPTSISNGG